MSDSQTSQPTILIKKSDGTSVRVTLDEFKKMRGSAQPALRVSSAQVQDEQDKTESKIKNEIKTDDESILLSESEFYSQSQSQSQPYLNISPPISTISQQNSTLPEINPPHELATTTPVTDIFIDEARAKSAWTPEDHRSPLEVDLSEIDALKKQGIEHTIPHVKIDSVVSMASRIPKELMPRFNALVLSYKKGVRSDPQFIEYVLRDTAHGGLGFSTEQMAYKLLEEVQQKTRVLHKATPQASIAPAVSRPPATPTSQVMPSAIDTQKQTEHIVTPSPSVVHDMVQPATQQTTGPEDEIAHFSLRDFRRLSKDPRVASEMLYEKFEGWKKDSFMLYMKTLLAWKRSPLYTQYIALTLKALVGHTSVKTILNTEQQQGGMNMQEYLELVALHGRLVV